MKVSPLHEFHIFSPAGEAGVSTLYKVMTMKIEAFHVETPDDALDNLRQRIIQARWMCVTQADDWSYGIPATYLRKLTDYWKRYFDWQVQEKYINSFLNYRVQIEGLGVHFVHIPGGGSNPLPLLLLHGWPSTFYEMLSLGKLLANPSHIGVDSSYACSVVIPSIPGHGYSDQQPPGFADRDVARLLVKLMKQMGYEQFGIHAYDLGASIAGLMCLDYPDAVIGYHTTSPGNPQPYLGPETEPLTEAESKFLEVKKKWYAQEGGYVHLLGTRPDTTSYALNDSPVGLAAWITEKWYLWTVPPSGNLDEHFSKDDLLTNITIYWLTQTIASANRYYREEVKWPSLGEIAKTPHGVALTVTQEFERPPREYVERLFPDIRRWIELPRGGHFVALEDPVSVAIAICNFFSELR